MITLKLCLIFTLSFMCFFFGLYLFLAISKKKENIFLAIKQALLCYDTYQEMVKTTNVLKRIGSKTYFELQNEKFDKVLTSVTELINL